MHRTSWRKRLCLVSFSGLLLSTAYLGERGQGGLHPKNPASETELQQHPTKRYSGVSACSICHTSPREFRDDPPVLCRCTELSIWEKADKHRVAYVNLSNSLGKQIIKILKYSSKDAEKNCASCHGVYVEDPSLKGSGFKIEDGVSCVACHGPYFDWVDVHGGTMRPEWLKKTRKEKEEKYGMTDLWDPVKRTQLCASCHVGNAREGKVVTHAMYAAGHPVLPGLEVSTFSDSMPRHWQYLHEKLKEKTKPGQQKLLKDYYQTPEFEQTKLVLVAGAISLRETMNLLAKQAQSAAEAKASVARSLDLAQFDCFACHHDLKTPSWRQHRGFAGKPGRPQFRPWPLALVKLGVLHAGRKESGSEAFSKELLLNVERLHAAFDAQPFGQLELVIPAAQKFAQWAETLAKKLDGVNYDREAALSLLRDLCSLATSALWDYESARQLAWAFNVIYGECNPNSAADVKIKEQQKIFVDQLNLDLPSGQQREILCEMPESLRRINEHDPDKFRQRFRELENLLSAK